MMYRDIENTFVGARILSDGSCGFCGMPEKECNCGQKRHELLCEKEAADEAAYRKRRWNR